MKWPQRMEAKRIEEEVREERRKESESQSKKWQEQRR